VVVFSLLEEENTVSNPSKNTLMVAGIPSGDLPPLKTAILEMQSNKELCMVDVSLIQAFCLGIPKKF